MLQRKHNEKVVILIDEYDKPYIDFYNDPIQAKEVRKVLANFYVRIKANDQYVKFVFITGISKFSGMGVFSQLNTLTDISLHDKYAAMCGITHEELLANFPEHIAETANKLQMSQEALVDKIKEYYNGFSFDGKTKLYNPYSVLLFFEKQRFSNHWFEVGTTYMMSEYIKNHNFTVEQFRNVKVQLDFLENPGEMDTASVKGFLYQCGFLTISKVEDDKYTLDYPNKEVLDAMSRLLATKILADNNENFDRYRNDVTTSIEKNKRVLKYRYILLFLQKISYARYTM
jgi:hypothetical protein